MTLKSELSLSLVILCVACAFALVTMPTPLSAQGPSPAAPPPSPTLKPGDGTYTVQSGDSAWTIAVKIYGNGNKYTQILTANNLSQNSRLRVGQVLIIPDMPEGKLTSSPAATTAPVSTLVPTLSVAPVFTAVPTVGAIPTYISPPTSAPTLVANKTQSSGPTAAEKSSLPPRTSAGVLSAMMTPEFMRFLDIISGVLAGSSVVCAFFAYQGYQRAQRLQRMTRVRRRSRVHIDHLT